MKTDRNRLLSTFTKLARIPSPSLKEKKVAEFVLKELRRYSGEIFIDSAAFAAGGETGNLVIKIPGDPSKKPFLLSAHLDTVAVSGPIKPRVTSKAVYSDGKTILGADCKAGIAIIIETVKSLKENKISHPPLELVFTISEENALLGAKNLDFSLIKSDRGLIFDNEQPFENIILKAPAANGFEIKIYGRASHSGVAPEEGISAIKAAAMAVSAMRLGRLDTETTSNIGFISGGEGINIIPPLVVLKGEIRSKKEKKIEKTQQQFRKCLQKAIDKYPGRLKPAFEFISETKFPALEISPSHPLVKLTSLAMSEMGFKPRFSSSGGGTDANIFSGKGIVTPILSTGMRLVHTPREYLDLKDFFNCAELTMRILEKSS